MSKREVKRKLTTAFAATASEAADTSDSDEEYDVEAILEEKNGLFFVKWAGYDTDDNTWEPASNLKVSMIRAFRRKQKRAKPAAKPTTPATTEGPGLLCPDQSTQLARVATTLQPTRCVRDRERDDTATTLMPDVPDIPESIVTAEDLLVGCQVCFSPANEDWMPLAKYRDVGAAFLTGLITRMCKGRGRNAAVLLEVRWSNTQYQGKDFIHEITREKAEEGVIAYKRLTGTELRPESWDVLCRPYREAQQCDDGDLLDDFEEIEDLCVRFQTEEPLAEDAEEVEKIRSMVFESNASLQAPDDLFRHEDESTEPRVKEEYKSIFRHSASSSFLAYLPLAFWKKVVENTNEYAQSQHGPKVTLDEMMKFVGILYYITLVDKGEFSNYWGTQVEDSIFDTSTG